MNKRIILPVFLVALLLIVSFLGCQKKTYSYPFDQDLDNVVSVEIRNYDWETRETTPFLTLDEDAAQSLLADIAALDCYKQYGDYSRISYSEIVVYITYEDGGVEMIGIRNTGGIYASGMRWTSSYYFDEEPWREVVSKYIDADLVAPSEKME